MEAVLPRNTSCGQQGYNYVAFALDENNVFGRGQKFILKTGVFVLLYASDG